MAKPDDAACSVVPAIFDGRVTWIFGDDFDVDNIIGPQNIKNYDPAFLRTVCMKSFDPAFAERVRHGDLIVGGRNFGYGHPHYPPIIALRSVGIVAIVAESFAPGFWRGETFNGMPLVECPGVSKSVRRWDRLKVHWKEGLIEVVDQGTKLQGRVPNERTVQIIEAGGGYQLLLNLHRRTRAGGQPAGMEQ